MTGPAVEREIDTRYEEAQYKLVFKGEHGTRSHVHVKRLKEDPYSEFDILPQGDRLHGLVAFYLYIYHLEGERPEIRSILTGEDWTYEW